MAYGKVFNPDVLQDFPFPLVVENAQTAIRVNQHQRAKLRSCHDEFDAVKINNAVQLGILQANGFLFDWQKNTAEKFPLAK